MLAALLMTSAACTSSEGGTGVSTVGTSEPPEPSSTSPFSVDRAADLSWGAAALTERSASVAVSACEGAFTIDYLISGGQAGELCSAEWRILTEHSGKRVELKLENPLDPNSEFVSSDAQTGEDGWAAVKRIVRLDANGEGRLSVTLNAACSEFELFDPIVRSLDEDADYALLGNESDIELIFLKADLEKLAPDQVSLEQLIGRLSALRRSIKSLCGDYEPYGGMTRFVFAESIPFSALAGDPIYVNRDELAYFLTDLEANDRSIDKNHPIAVLCHEMSHTFDFAGSSHETAGYCFDKELFAAFKQLYALRSNGYAVDYDFLADSPDLADRIYNYEVLLRRIVEACALLDGGDWSSVGRTLSALRDSSESDRFNAFMTTLSDESGVDLYAAFDDAERGFLFDRFAQN